MIGNIRNNWPYKLLALAVSCILWLHVNSERYPQSHKTVTVPVSIRNLDKGYMAELSTQEVSVTVEGLRSTVDAVRKDDVHAWLDLAGLASRDGATVQDMKVRTSISGFPEGEVDYSVNPNTINVRIEATSAKRLPIETKFLAAAPVGYIFGDPNVTPASATIQGRSSQVSRVKRLVLTIPDRRTTRLIDEIFPLTPMDEQGNKVTSVTVEPRNVHLSVRMLEVSARKAVLVSPTLGEARYPSRISAVTVEPSSVSLEGRPADLASVSMIATRNIDIDQEDSSFSRQVELDIPAGLTVVGPHSVRVTVTIVSVDNKKN